MIISYDPTFQNNAPGEACSFMNSQAFASYVGAEGKGGFTFVSLLKGISHL
jgi:hypothetical protein